MKSILNPIQASNNARMLAVCLNSQLCPQTLIFPLVGIRNIYKTSRPSKCILSIFSHFIASEINIKLANVL